MSVNIPAAITALAAAGIKPRDLAHDLKLSERTITRWVKGTNHPRPRNLAALRELVDRLLAETLAGQTLLDTEQGERLQDAKLALTGGGDALAEALTRFLATADTDARYRLAVGRDPYAERCEVDEAQTPYGSARELLAAA